MIQPNKNSYIPIINGGSPLMTQALSYMIMQSDENRTKVEYLIDNGISFEDALNELGLDKSDFTDNDYKYLVDKTR